MPIRVPDQFHVDLLQWDQLLLREDIRQSDVSIGVELRHLNSIILSGDRYNQVPRSRTKKMHPSGKVMYPSVWNCATLT